MELWRNSGTTLLPHTVEREVGRGWRMATGEHGDPALSGAQRLQATVYRAHGFITEGQAIDENGVLVDRWSPAATHFGLYRNDKPVGHMRLLDRRCGPLPTEALCPDLELPVGCWEVSGLAVSTGGVRFFGAAKQLYRDAFHFANDAGCTHWVGLIEYPLFRILTRMLRFPFEVVASDIPYGPTTNVAAVLDFETVFERFHQGQIDDWFARR